MKVIRYESHSLNSGFTKWSHENRSMFWKSLQNRIKECSFYGLERDQLDLPFGRELSEFGIQEFVNWKLIHVSKL